MPKYLRWQEITHTYVDYKPLADSSYDKRDKRKAVQGFKDNSAMLADDAFADDVVTDDDHGKYYERQTIVESGLSNYV